MKRNIGGVDRGIRILGGLVLVALAMADKAGLWAWLGMVPVLAGFLGWCPIYRVLSIDTCNVYPNATPESA